MSGGGNLGLFSQGFTLAEVLITLGIIGVVAALTLPAVINNTERKERQEALKKAYSTLQQALLMYQKDLGEVPTKSTFNTEAGSLKKALLPYFKGAIDCGKGTESTACIYFYDDSENKNNIYKNYNNTADIQIAYFDDGQYVLSDGMMYFFENNIVTNSVGNVFVSVDVNGFKKRPNKWGRDLFTFELTDSGKLLPMGAVGTKYEKNADSYCNQYSTSPMNGIGCANRALYDESFWK